MRWYAAQEPASNPYEEFARVFSMFATAEEVTKTGLGEEEEKAQEAEAKETDEVKVNFLKCCPALVLHVHGPTGSGFNVKEWLTQEQTPHSSSSCAHLTSGVNDSAEAFSGAVGQESFHD